MKPEGIEKVFLGTRVYNLELSPLPETARTWCWHVFVDAHTHSFTPPFLGIHLFFLHGVPPLFPRQLQDPSQLWWSFLDPYNQVVASLCFPRAVYPHDCVSFGLLIMSFRLYGSQLSVCLSKTGPAPFAFIFPYLVGGLHILGME